MVMTCCCLPYAGMASKKLVAWGGQTPSICKQHGAHFNHGDDMMFYGEGLDGLITYFYSYLFLLFVFPCFLPCFLPFSCLPFAIHLFHCFVRVFFLYVPVVFFRSFVRRSFFRSFFLCFFISLLRSFSTSLLLCLLLLLLVSVFLSFFLADSAACPFSLPCLLCFHCWSCLLFLNLLDFCFGKKPSPSIALCCTGHGFSHAPGSSRARNAAERGHCASSGREANNAQVRWANAHVGSISDSSLPSSNWMWPHEIGLDGLARCKPSPKRSLLESEWASRVWRPHRQPLRITSCPPKLLEESLLATSRYRNLVSISGSMFFAM